MADAAPASIRRSSFLLLISLLALTALVFFGALAGFGRTGQKTAPPESEAARSERSEPIAVPPFKRPLLRLSDTDRQLLNDRIQPRSGGRKSNVSFGVHWLRFHRLNARFPKSPPPCRSSEEVLGLLTSAEAGAAYFGHPAFARTRWGARYESRDDGSGTSDDWQEFHRDQCLAAFAELRLPLDQPLHWGNQSLAIRDLLADSLANFHLQQKELEWTGLAYALYLPPSQRWTNRYGEAFSFDDLARELLERPLSESSCAGTHILYTLTILARADQQIPLFGEPTRRRIHERLTSSVAEILRWQDADGSWPYDWYRNVTRVQSGQGWFRPPDDPWIRLLVTSHLAEGLLYLPPEFQGSQLDGALRRAGEWLLVKMRTPEAAEAPTCPRTHAACVLTALDSSGET